MTTITVPRKPSALDLSTATIAALKALQANGAVRIPSARLRAYVTAQAATHGLNLTAHRSTLRKDS